MAAHIIRGRMRRTLTLLAALAATLAGCGGGDGGGGPATTVAAGKPFVVKADEYRFAPKNVVLKAGSNAPTPLTIRLTNGGAQAHDLHVERGGQDLGGTPIFGPGQTKTAKVTLTPGTYDFVCTVGDHEQLGMKGTLTVK
jgi:plastocyanin